MSDVDPEGTPEEASRVRTLTRPGHRETLWVLEAAFDRGDLVTLFGRCSVEYDGRATSSLGAGDRLLVLKPDGAALVHTDEKRTPVNWQPPGSEHRVAVREGRLVVRSVRSTPEEILEVRFERVRQFSALSVSGGRDIDLVGSEEDLRERVLSEPDLVEPGFDPEATERETAAGPVDVFGSDETGKPVVVELKRRRVGPDAAGQLRRYVDALEREFGEPVRGVLVAPSVTERTRALLEDEGLELVRLDPPEGNEEVTDADPAADTARDADGTREDAGDGA